MSLFMFYSHLLMLYTLVSIRATFGLPGCGKATKAQHLALSFCGLLVACVKSNVLHGQYTHVKHTLPLVLATDLHDSVQNQPIWIYSHK